MARRRITGSRGIGLVGVDGQMYVTAAFFANRANPIDICLKLATHFQLKIAKSGANDVRGGLRHLVRFGDCHNPDYRERSHERRPRRA